MMLKHKANDRSLDCRKLGVYGSEIAASLMMELCNIFGERLGQQRLMIDYNKHTTTARQTYEFVDF